MEEKIENVVARMQQGDLKAFEKLLHLFSPQVLSFIKKYIKNASDADDICQETFIRVFRYRLSYKSRQAKFKTWLLRIAMNLVTNALKKQQKEIQHLRNYHQQRERQDVAHDQTSTAEVLEIAIGELSLKHQHVIRLSTDYSIEDMAEILKCPPGTVKSRLFHARALLYDKLKGKDL
ncbi:RNA polymerase sigma factor [Candidatus Uabimicrobium amorphum]|uniref:RNA polymerase sigma factor n=1 Tax=Uabimicrobium amorphum TaxID=2596890 RepID=A0A5S9F1D2_UABAM|nr:sigma-70 family RNA polymerase sigma factor [Candidatus Uabimicrobium amorphum]BBM82446.1 RNA polymerase sigma factor [Candidatus Uabimicrobium amorphum]